jgi:hypothetical protein
MATIEIVIPTYRGIHPEAFQALISMQQATNCMCRDQRTGAPLHLPWKCPNGKHHVRFAPHCFASSVVHWARNQSVAQALYGQPKDGRPPSDYLFCMDDDMLSMPNYLTRLAAYKLDVVVGICTIKRDPPIPNIRFWNPKTHGFFFPIEWDWDSNRLMEIDAAGAAFMLVKRNVFERMGQAYLDCEFEIIEDCRKVTGDDAIAQVKEHWAKRAVVRRERFNAAIKEDNWSATDCWWFSFENDFMPDQTGELGEDVSFCCKAKRLGFKIWADPQVLPGHLGMYGYSISDHREFVEQAKKIGGLPEMQENRVALEV